MWRDVLDYSKLIKELIDIFKIKNIIIFCFLASSILLFTPDQLLDKIYLVDFRNKYGFIIGIIFYLSIVIILVYLINDKISTKIDLFRYKQKINSFLHKLDDITAIAIISKFLKSKDNTLYLKMNTGSVARLRSVGIISPTNDTNAVYDITEPKIPFLMQPMVYDIIKKDEGLFNKFKNAKNVDIDTDNPYENNFY